MDSILSISIKTNEGQDFRLLLGDFLDEFYRSNQNIQSNMIAESPENINNPELIPFLAAAAHKLANDFNLPLPNWIFDKRCYMPDNKPYFGCETKGNLSLWFMYNSPAEFKHRNIFFGDNVLTRV